MRRRALRSGIAPVLGLLLSASASAAEQPPGVRVVRPEARQAAAAPTASAPRATAEPDTSVTAVHAPLPVPQMPVPEGLHRRPAADARPFAPVFDVPLAPL